MEPPGHQRPFQQAVHCSEFSQLGKDSEENSSTAQDTASGHRGCGPAEIIIRH